MSTEQAEQTANAALATVTAEIAELCGWDIEDAEGNALAGEMLADVKGRFKRLEVERKKITTPMNAALKAVNLLFRAPKDRLTEAERILKGKIALYLERVACTNDAAYTDAGAASTPEEATAALDTVETAAPPKGVTVRYVYRARIVNEGMLARDLLAPDMGKIAELMKARKLDDGSPAPIPGVLFDREAIVGSRST